MISTKKFSLLISMTLLSLASSAQAESEKGVVQSPFKTCEDVKLVDHDEYKKNKSMWDDKCRDNSAYQILPRTKFATTEIQEATESLQFLLAIAGEVKSTFDGKLKEKVKLLRCFQTRHFPEEANTPECVSARKKEIDTAYENLPKVRQELALAEGSFKKGRGGVGWNSDKEWINSNLKKGFFGMTGVYRAEDTQPLSESEAQEALSTIKAEMEPALQKSHDEAQAAFDQIQTTHKENYLTLLQEAPSLMHIGTLPDRSKVSEEVLNKRFEQAYTQIISDARTTQNKLDEAIKKGKVDADDNQKSVKGLLTFLAYEPIVEKVLAEQKARNPKICAIATGLFNYKEMKDTREILGETVSIIGGATLAATKAGAVGRKLAERNSGFGKFTKALGMNADALTAVALGPGLGYAFRSKALDEMESKRGGVATQVNSAQQVDQAEGEVIANYALIGLDFAGTGIGTAAFRAMSNKGTARQLLTNQTALKAHGLKEKEVDQLLKLAESSSDAKVRAEAQKKIEEAVRKIPKETQKATIEATQKEFFGGRKPTQAELTGINQMADAGYATELSEAVRKLSKQDRSDFIRRTTDSFKKLNRDLYEQTDKKTAEKAITAAMHFGSAKDPDRIAKVLNEWKPKGENPEALKGIEGLTTVLRKASGKLKDPAQNAAYRKIADAELRQQKAFDGTLRELLKKDEKFTALPKEKQEAQIKEMNTCYFGK